MTYLPKVSQYHNSHHIPFGRAELFLCTWQDLPLHRFKCLDGGNLIHGKNTLTPLLKRSDLNSNNSQNVWYNPYKTSSTYHSPQTHKHKQTLMSNNINIVKYFHFQFPSPSRSDPTFRGLQQLNAVLLETPVSPPRQCLLLSGVCMGFTGSIGASMGGCCWHFTQQKHLLSPNNQLERTLKRK